MGEFSGKTPQELLGLQGKAEGLLEDPDVKKALRESVDEHRNRD